MFKLLDRVVDGISPMLNDLESHITSAGQADMLAVAETITQVNVIYRQINSNITCVSLCLKV